MVFIMMIITLIIVSITSSNYFVSGLNFSSSSFSANNVNNEFRYEGDSSAVRGAMELTQSTVGSNRELSIGRVTYCKPMHLWDKASKNLTDFTTHFKFVIDSLNKSEYGDGLAFFLAPNGSSQAPQPGAALGLPYIDGQPINTTNTFVAVEFDIYPNKLDPKYTNSREHVGIDINSLISVANVSWPYGTTSIMNGWTNEAWISYVSSSKNLSVVFGTSLDGNLRIINQSLHFLVDLREYLPEYVTFGFSAASGLSTSIERIISWEFYSSMKSEEDVPDHLIDEYGVAPVPSPPRTQKDKKIGLGLIVGLSVGGFVFICACVTGIFVILQKQKRKAIEDNIFVDDDSMDGEFEKGTGPKRFSYNALAQATSNFSHQEKLGQGGFGGVYRGFLKELNSCVAVKKVSRDSVQGIKEYASEVRIISRLRHKNLVQLIGWCHEKNNLLLVYEYMENGSLDSHLFKGQSFLSWSIRFNIAQGLASVLLYLHEEWEQCVVHRDIKSSNIMLDSNFNTKLGDFGLARFVDHEKGMQTTIVAGTPGYIAPECFVTGQSSKESDVFSFGVVALEIACGRRPFEPKVEECQRELVKWVWDLYGTEQILEAADSTLSGDYDEHEMKLLMIVGLWCAHPISTNRPSIRQAIHALSLDVPLPALPSKMPAPTYASPTNIFSLSLAHSQATTESSQTGSSSYSNNTDSSLSASASLLHNTR